MIFLNLTCLNMVCICYAFKFCYHIHPYMHLISTTFLLFTCCVNMLLIQYLSIYSITVILYSTCVLCFGEISLRSWGCQSCGLYWIRSASVFLSTVWQERRWPWISACGSVKPNTSRAWWEKSPNHIWGECIDKRSQMIFKLTLRCR